MWNRIAVSVALALVLAALLLAALSSPASGRVAGHDHPAGTLAFGALGGLAMPRGQLDSEADWTGTVGNGIDLNYSWSGSAFGEFYVRDWFTIGLAYERSDLRGRDANFFVGGVPRVIGAPITGMSWMYGLRLRAFLPSQRSWTPYVFAGLDHFFRDLDLSPAIAEVAPTTQIFDVEDDVVGFDVGLGMEQPITRSVGFDSRVTYLSSGPLQHDAPWAGRVLQVNAWRYWTAEVGLTWRPTFPD